MVLSPGLIRITGWCQCLTDSRNAFWVGIHPSHLARACSPSDTPEGVSFFRRPYPGICLGGWVGHLRAGVERLRRAMARRMPWCGLPWKVPAPGPLTWVRGQGNPQGPHLFPSPDSPVQPLYRPKVASASLRCPRCRAWRCHALESGQTPDQSEPESFLGGDYCCAGCVTW